MDIEKIADGVFKAVEGRLERALAPLFERLEAIEARATPAVSDLIGAPELKTLVDLQVAESVAEYMAENPPRDGKDGAPGEKGEPGADGVGLAGFLANEAGELIATNTKGELFNLGRIRGMDGKDGERGADGLGFDDMTVTFNEDHTFTLAYIRGNERKEFTSPQLGIRHKGYWREGMQCKQGDIWVHAGCAWIAKADTATKPERNNEAWEVFASKGRDGERGPPGKDYQPPQPVKLHG